MAQPKSSFQLKWYHVLLIVLALVVVLWAAATLVLVNSPLANRVASQAAQGFADLAEVQTKVANQFSLIPAQVGVQASTNAANSNTTQRITISLANTPVNDLSETDKFIRTRQIATFAKDTYARTSDIDEYCVVLVRATQIIIFSSSRAETTCYRASEL